MTAPRWSEKDLENFRDTGAPVPKERDVQRALFEWADASAHPALDLLYAVPNGQMRPGSAPEPGLRSGVPDVCLPVGCGKYSALYLELKRLNGVPSDVTDAQDRWLTSLCEAGNAGVVAYGYDSAVRVISNYLDASLPRERVHASDDSSE